MNPDPYRKRKLHPDCGEALVHTIIPSIAAFGQGMRISPASRVKMTMNHAP
jgi:hypothetical protein